MKKKFWRAIVILMSAAMLLGAALGLSACGGGGVERVKIGDTRDEVVKILGEPAEDESSEYVYHYYGKAYTKILDEEKELEEKLLKTTDGAEIVKILEAIAVLDAKLETLVYEYTTIEFNGQGLVSSVRMDANHNAQNPPPKQVKKSSLEPQKVSYYAEEGKALPYLRVWYTDGSYQCVGFEKISSAIVKSEFWHYTDAQMTYTDDWGEYTAPVKKSKLKFEPGTWSSGSAGTGTFKATITDKQALNDVKHDSGKWFQLTISVEIFGSGTFALTQDDQLLKEALYNYMFYVLSPYDTMKVAANFLMPEGITEIADEGFVVDEYNYFVQDIVSLSLPKSLISIGKLAFSGFKNLTTIQYNDSVSAWAALAKGEGWNSNTGDYTIVCTDGTIAKDGTVTMK